MHFLDIVFIDYNYTTLLHSTKPASQTLISFGADFTALA